MARLLTALLVALPLSAGAQDAAAPEAAPGTPARAEPAPPPERDGAEPGRVYAGVGLGPVLVSGGGGESDGTAYRVRLGVARSPRTTLGLEAGFSSRPREDFTWCDVGATFFPWGRYLYLRGAVGLSVRSEEREGRTDQGLNALAGVGAAIGRPRGVTVSINVEAQSHAMGGGTDRVGAVSAWLGLDWY
jgi:hypothetical protein